MQILFPDRAKYDEYENIKQSTQFIIDSIVHTHMAKLLPPTAVRLKLKTWKTPMGKYDTRAISKYTAHFPDGPYRNCIKQHSENDQSGTWGMRDAPSDFHGGRS